MYTRRMRTRSSLSSSKPTFLSTKVKERERERKSGGRRGSVMTIHRYHHHYHDDEYYNMPGNFLHPHPHNRFKCFPNSSRYFLSPSLMNLSYLPIPCSSSVKSSLSLSISAISKPWWTNHPPRTRTRTRKRKRITMMWLLSFYFFPFATPTFTLEHMDFHSLTSLLWHLQSII
jgi:hypothetical protein